MPRPHPWSLFFAWLLLVVGVAGRAEGTNQRELLTALAPVILQRVEDDSRFDYLAGIDFDGNWDVRDNTRTTDLFPQIATVYAEVFAETADTLYLTYNVYHTRDWVEGWTKNLKNAHHNNDLEGIVLAVDRQSHEVLAGVARWHLFLRFARNRTAFGEGGAKDEMLFHEGHVLIEVEAKGHGVNFTRSLEHVLRSVRKPGRSLIVYHPAQQGAVPVPGRASQDVGYSLTPMALFYKEILRELESGVPSTVFGENRVPYLGLLLPGYFLGSYEWSEKKNVERLERLICRGRPGMPWTWGKKADGGPAAWYFDPAVFFNKNFGWNRSTEYVASPARDFLAAFAAKGR